MAATYASQSDVEPLIKFISDDASDDLFETVLDNAANWINARLLSQGLPEPDNTYDDLLQTAAIYYAASDVILALYNGEDLPTQFDTYFQKAESMLDLYITQQKDLLANTELRDTIIVKHSKSRPYMRKGL